MTTERWPAAMLALLAATAIGACGGDDEAGSGASTDLPRFGDPARIDNPYLPLTEHARCDLRGEEDGEPIRIVRRLLDETKAFDVGGRTVEAAVIEDSEFAGGELVERTRDYFAQADDGTVHYLGEDVDDYENGKVVGHGGAWLYGRDTDTLGVAMAANPAAGTRWRSEDVPGVTRETIRVVERLDAVRVRGADYRDVIRVRESIQPEGEIEHKLYARGFGVIRELPPDGRVELAGCR